MLIISTVLTGQDYYLNGYVSDKNTGENIIGANVTLSDRLGTITDEYGYFTLPKTTNVDTLIVSYVGYESVEIPVHGLKDSTVHIRLKNNLELSEVEIKENRNTSASRTN